MKVYIKGMGNISPQQTWNDETVLLQAFDYRGNRLTCVEPDYSQYIDPRHLRRMSRIIKMGVASAMMAMKDAEITQPHGIITGTGYGCLEDTGSFLTRMVENNEQALNPTPFIQSTHNTIGSQIALLIQCYGYNQTYAHRAFSFESALIDACMQLEENPNEDFLVGAVDEITEISHIIQSRFGIFRQKLASTINLFHYPKAGTIHGEGAAYFVLSGTPGKNYPVSIDNIRMLYRPTHQSLRETIEAFIKESGLRPAEIDLLLLGKSGDRQGDQDIDNLCKAIFPSSSIALFKHLCGEFPVSSSFALWLGTRIITEHHIPEVAVFKDTSRPLKRVLIYNTYFENHHSLILLRACQDTIK
jgi:hypothetical protein